MLPFAAWLSNIQSGLAHSLLKPVALRSALSTNGACRFREADPTDLQVLFSRSRARHTPPAPPDLRLVQRILEICTAPPENAARVRRGLVPFSTISNATLTYRLRASSLHTHESSKSCTSLASSSIRPSVRASHWSRVTLCRKSKWTLNMQPPFLLTPRENGSMCSILCDVYRNHGMNMNSVLIVENVREGV